MSRTDKTRPVAIQFRDPANRHLMIEQHDHRHGVCDLEAWLADKDDLWGWDYHCRLYKSYYELNRRNFWPRPPKGSWDRTGRHSHIRTLWRKQRGQLLRGEIEDGDKPTSKWYKRDMWDEYSM